MPPSSSAYTSADSASVVGSSLGGAGGAPSERGGSSIAFSQSDRLRRRGSVSSWAGTSELGSALSAYDYKSQEDAADLDDVKSQYTSTQSQAGLTVF